MYLKISYLYLVGMTKTYILIELCSAACAFLLLMAVTLCRAHPSGDRTESGNLVGEATNILAADVLRANADSDKNFVFSPLGFTSILAMLSEGARGETAERMGAALHHPTDKSKGT